MLREAMLGLLPSDSRAVSTDDARKRCLTLPVAAPEDRIEGPHGETLLGAECKVVEHASLGTIAGSKWEVAHYRWTSTFTAEDAARGPQARDTVEEEEVVVFEAAEERWRPVWHARFELGNYGPTRSITPSLAPSADGGVLMSVQSCVNGTGGCAQEFLRRTAGGTWRPIWQTWFDELPDRGADRIRHGTQIDPVTLRGQAGFYRDDDANCCPSDRLEVQLGLEGDQLVLKSSRVIADDPH